MSTETDDAYADQAKVLVDSVIEMAIKRLETNLSLMSDKERTFESMKISEMSRESTLARDENYVVENISWLTIGDFSVDDAVRKIDDFIQVSRPRRLCSFKKYFFLTGELSLINACCWRADHKILIHDGASRSELIFVSARQHVLISNNSPVRTNYFDSNII